MATLKTLNMHSQVPTRTHLAMLLCYDVVDGRSRRQIIHVCQDYGLIRVQCSVFAGFVRRTRLHTFEHRLNLILKDSAARMILMPIGPKQLSDLRYSSANLKTPTILPLAAAFTSRPMSRRIR